MNSSTIDETHDPSLSSWVAGASAHPDYPIQNLPLCSFSASGKSPRVGAVIGDHVLDIAALAGDGRLRGQDRDCLASITGSGLNAYFGVSAGERRQVRQILSAFLRTDGGTSVPNPERYLTPTAAVAFHLPCDIGDYSDFFAGIHHARNAGGLKRPDKPLSVNYKYLPVAYHGRSSSVRTSEEPVIRPWGQVMKGEPVFQPTEQLDFELELALWLGPGNKLGRPISIATAGNHIAGVGLLNDWSARDIQSWEAQPLGPFLGKSFLTSVSPLVITVEALAPFRTAQLARPPDDPDVPANLYDGADQSTGAFDIQFEAFLSTLTMRAENMAAFRLSRSAARHLYWTPAQLLAHQSSNGCPIRAGDLIGSGTISAPEPGGEGSLLESSRGGTTPITLPSGEVRCFLEQGDEVVLRGWCERDGFRRIGLGEVRGTVVSPRVGAHGPSAIGETVEM